MAYNQPYGMPYGLHYPTKMFYLIQQNKHHNNHNITITFILLLMV